MCYSAITMDRKELLSQIMAELGSKGGKKTASKRTKAERVISARKAAKARWAEESAKQKKSKA